MCICKTIKRSVVALIIAVVAVRVCAATRESAGLCGRGNGRAWYNTGWGLSRGGNALAGRTRSLQSQN
jgi:hypothetical protein